MGQSAVQDFFIGEADGLFDNKVHNLAESGNYTEGLMCHVIHLSDITVFIARFVMLQAEKPAASET